MAIALEHENELARMAANIRQRPNGQRVLRLVREIIGMGRIGLLPVLLALLVAGGLLVVMLTGQLPAAQGKVLFDSADAVDGVVQAHMQPTPQQVDYEVWVRQAHAQVAAQGDSTPLPETF